MIHPSSYDAQPLVSMSLGSWILVELYFWILRYRMIISSASSPASAVLNSKPNSHHRGGRTVQCLSSDQFQFSSVLISLCAVGAFESRHDMHQSATGKIRCRTKTPPQLSLSYPPPLSSQHGVCLFRYDSDLSW